MEAPPPNIREDRSLLAWIFFIHSQSRGTSNRVLRIRCSGTQCDEKKFPSPPKIPWTLWLVQLQIFFQVPAVGLQKVKERIAPFICSFLASRPDSTASKRPPTDFHQVLPAMPPPPKRTSSRFLQGCCWDPQPSTNHYRDQMVHWLQRKLDADFFNELLKASLLSSNGLLVESSR